MPWQIICNDSEILAIHAALLPIGNRGQVVLFGGDEHNPAQAGRDASPADPAQVDNTRIHDLDADPGHVITIGSPATDVFCSGHAFLGDGRLVIGGGTESWEPNGGGGPGGGHVHGLGEFGGHTATWAFNFRRRTWERLADFNFIGGTATGEGQGGGRWYPTLLTLPTGDLIAFSGHPSRRSRQWHNNNIPEIYSFAANAWRRLARHDDLTFYPRAHLVRGNQIFVASGTFLSGTSRFLDLNAGAMTPQVIPRMSGGNLFYEGFGSSSVLLPLLPSDDYRPRILMCNDVLPIRFDPLSAPNWQITGARPSARVRQFACSTILPNGKILINGGVEDPPNDNSAVKEAEIYDPGIDWNTGAYTIGTGSWSVGDAATVPRNYHSTALLLPDGSVWTAGSSKGATRGDPMVVGERRIEIYLPDYFSNPACPDLTNAPQSIDYQSNSFVLRTPQRNQIQRVALIRCGSSTHAGNFDQRYVGLSFLPTPGVADGLTATYPVDPSVLPPGYYMLWIVNNAGLPCKNAKFIRVARRGCHLLLDHSTYSSLEVEALLSQGSVARFSKALFVVLDGYLPGEVSGAPSLQLFYDSNGGAAVPGVVLEPNGAPEFEHAPPPDDVPQRITFAFDVVFNNAAAVSAANLPLTDRPVAAVATFGSHTAQGDLKFTRKPNPYMTDGPVEWLSTDLRVFKILASDSRAGIPHTGTANQFIRALLTRFNLLPDDGSHPFLSIPSDPEASSLEMALWGGFLTPVDNFAVAKVRYRALSTPANNVRVFFRMCQAATTDVSFNETTIYRRAGLGANAISLLGKFGNAIASIPFFADERIDSSVAPMTAQLDNTNRKNLPSNPSGAESVIYFGCWLDINQTTPQYPLFPTNDGPFAAVPFALPFFPFGRLSIQQLMRGTHQCLVAEIHYDLDPIPFGATPGSSDNLSQRNVVIDHSDNPGGNNSRIVSHPFELKPSQGTNFIFSVPDAFRNYRRPDELMIHWGNLPRASIISVYLPDVRAEDILALQAATRLSSTSLEEQDDHTIRCVGGADITYLPIPPTGKNENMTGLFTVELPSGISKGELFHAVVQQIEGATGRIIGTFQVTIPVSTADILLAPLSRKLSVLKHIHLAIPPTDRWFAVFNRYLTRFSDKVDAIGGDADGILPSSTGFGPAADAQTRKFTLCLALQWLASLLLAILCAVVALVPPVVAGILATVLIVMLLATGSFFAIRCRPLCCTWLKAGLIGSSVAAVVLGSMHLLMGLASPALVAMLSLLSVVNFALLIAALWKNCFGSSDK